MTNVHFHKSDIPTDIDWGDSVAVDTETTGLHLHRDTLCVVQLSSGDGTAHVVQMDRSTYDCPNLKSMLADTNITKLFHFGRFDLAMLDTYLGVSVAPVYCTKIASKLVRTYTDRHGLKDLCRELIGIELSKQQQSSDWASAELSDAQLQYAASDVLYLHRLRDELNKRLDREGRLQMAYDCFDFLPQRAKLDLMGWEDVDIFAHS